MFNFRETIKNNDLSCYFQAPITEEFIFRACMMPFLIPTIGEGAAVFVCPLFFGVGKFSMLFL